MENKIKLIIVSSLLSFVVFFILTYFVLNFSPKNVTKSRMLPLSSTASSSDKINNMLGQCVTSIDSKGFAQIGACNAAYKKFYEFSIHESEIKPPQLGKSIEILDASLNLPNSDTGYKYKWFSETVTKSIISLKDKDKHLQKDLDKLVLACHEEEKFKSNYSFITKVHSGCSNVSVLNSSGLFSSSDDDGILNGEVKVAVNKTIGFETIKSPKGSEVQSCNANSAFAVEVMPLLEVCKGIRLYRKVQVEETLVHLEKENGELTVKLKNATKYNQNLESAKMSLNARIEELRKRNEDLANKESSTVGDMVKMINGLERKLAAAKDSLVLEKDLSDKRKGKNTLLAKNLKEIKIDLNKKIKELTTNLTSKDDTLLKVNETNMAQIGELEKTLEKKDKKISGLVLKINQLIADSSDSKGSLSNGKDKVGKVETNTSSLLAKK